MEEGNKEKEGYRKSEKKGKDRKKGQKDKREKWKGVGEMNQIL